MLTHHNPRLVPSARAARSLCERDEFGVIDREPCGLFADSLVPVALLELTDQHGRPAGRWVPDEHLL
jgi:hypothetical protein